MVHVKNAGTAATTDTAVVSLSIDGVRRATTTVDPIAAGSETIAAIEGMVLSSGTYVDSVTVNDGRAQESSALTFAVCPNAAWPRPARARRLWATGDSVRLVDE